MKKTEKNEFTEFLEKYPGINLLEPSEASEYFNKFLTKKYKSNEKK